MGDHTDAEARAALAPIASLLSKSEKAQQKLAVGTWQHAMLRDNISALSIAYELLNRAGSDAAEYPRGDLEQALVALASMIARTEKSGSGFVPGTPQHTLQRNRLRALRVAEASIRRELAAG